MWVSFQRTGAVHYWSNSYYWIYNVALEYVAQNDQEQKNLTKLYAACMDK